MYRICSKDSYRGLCKSEDRAPPLETLGQSCMPRRREVCAVPTLSFCLQLTPVLCVDGLHLQAVQIFKSPMVLGGVRTQHRWGAY